MKRSTILINALILLVIFAIGAGPWILVAIAGSIATANGCQLDEGSVHPCIVNGQDMGDTLYSMGLMGWIGVLTCPVALILLAAYGIIVLILWLVRRNRAKQA